MKAELKTKVNDGDVLAFLRGIADERKRADSLAVFKLMRQVTKKAPKMWGSSIIGFGSYHYRYQSGREGDWFLTGFSPRKRNLTLYVMSGFERYPELLKRLGKFKTGKSCLYVNKLEDIHLPTLRQLIRESVKHMVKTNKWSTRPIAAGPSCGGGSSPTGALS